MTESESGIHTLYTEYPEEQIDHYVEVFQTEATYLGYDGPVFNSPRIYRMQVWISWLKWVVPTVLILASGLLLWRGKSNV